MASSSQNKALLEVDAASTFENSETSIDILNEMTPFLDVSNLNTLKLNESPSNTYSFTTLPQEDSHLEQNMIEDIVSYKSPLKTSLEDSDINLLQDKVNQSMNTNSFLAFTDDGNICSVQAIKSGDSFPVGGGAGMEMKANYIANNKNNPEDFRKNSFINSGYADIVQTTQKTESVKGILDTASSSENGTRVHYNCENTKNTGSKTELIYFDQPTTVIKKSFILPTTPLGNKILPIVLREKINSITTKSTIDSSRSSKISPSKSPRACSSKALSPSRKFAVNSSVALATSPSRVLTSISGASTASPSAVSTFSPARAVAFSPSRATISPLAVSRRLKLSSLNTPTAIPPYSINSASKSSASSASRASTLSPSTASIFSTSIESTVNSSRESTVSSSGDSTVGSRESSLSPSRTSAVNTSKASTLGTSRTSVILSGPSTVTSSRSSTFTLPRMSVVSVSRAPTISPLKMSTVNTSTEYAVSPLRTSTVSPLQTSRVTPSRVLAVTPSSALKVTPSRTGTISSGGEYILSPSSISTVNLPRALIFSPSRTSTVTSSRTLAINPSMASTFSTLTKSSDDKMISALPFLTNTSQTKENSRETGLHVEMPPRTNEKHIIQHKSDNMMISEVLTPKTIGSSANNPVTNVLIEMKKSPKKITFPVKLLQPHTKFSRTDLPINRNSLKISRISPLAKISQTELSTNENNAQKQLQFQPRKYIPTILLRTNRNQQKNNLPILNIKSPVKSGQALMPKKQTSSHTTVNEPEYPKLSSTYLNAESGIINNMSSTKTSDIITTVGIPLTTSVTFPWMSDNVNNSTVSTNSVLSSAEDKNNENLEIIDNSEYTPGPFVFVNNQAKELITETVIPLMTTSDATHSFVSSNDSLTAQSLNGSSDNSDILRNSDNIIISSAKDAAISTTLLNYQEKLYTLPVNSQAATKMTDPVSVRVIQNPSKVHSGMTKSLPIHVINEMEEHLQENYGESKTVVFQDNPYHDSSRSASKFTKDIYMNVLKSHSLPSEENLSYAKDTHVDANRISEMTENNNDSLRIIYERNISAKKCYERARRRGRGRGRGRRPNATMMGRTGINNVMSERDCPGTLYNDELFPKTYNSTTNIRRRGRGRGTRMRGRRVKHLNDQTEEHRTIQNENLKLEETHNNLQNNEIPLKKRKYTRRESISNAELLTAVRQIEMEKYNFEKNEEETYTSALACQQNSLLDINDDKNTDTYPNFMHQNQKSISCVPYYEFTVYRDGVQRTCQQNTQQFNGEYEINFENTITSDTTQSNSHDDQIHNNYNPLFIDLDNLEGLFDPGNQESVSYINNHQGRTRYVKPETNRYTSPAEDDYFQQIGGFLYANKNDQQISSENVVNSVAQNDAQNSSDVWKQNCSTTSSTDYEEDAHQPIIMNLDEQPSYDSVLKNEEKMHLLKFINAENNQNEYKNDFQFCNTQENMNTNELQQTAYNINPYKEFDTRQANVYQYSGFPEQIDGIAAPARYDNNVRGYQRQKRSRARGFPGGRSRPEKPYICPICGTCEQYNVLLKRHLQVEHGSDINYLEL